MSSSSPSSAVGPSSRRAAGNYADDPEFQPNRSAPATRRRAAPVTPASTHISPAHALSAAAVANGAAFPVHTPSPSATRRSGALPVVPSAPTSIIDSTMIAAASFQQQQSPLVSASDIVAGFAAGAGDAHRPSTRGVKRSYAQGDMSDASDGDDENEDAEAAMANVALGGEDSDDIDEEQIMQTSDAHVVQTLRKIDEELQKTYAIEEGLAAGTLKGLNGPPRKGENERQRQKRLRNRAAAIKCRNKKKQLILRLQRRAIVLREHCRLLTQHMGSGSAATGSAMSSPVVCVFISSPSRLTLTRSSPQGPPVPAISETMRYLRTLLVLNGSITWNGDSARIIPAIGQMLALHAASLPGAGPVDHDDP